MTEYTASEPAKNKSEGRYRKDGLRKYVSRLRKASSVTEWVGEELGEGSSSAKIADSSMRPAKLRCLPAMTKV